MRRVAYPAVMILLALLGGCLEDHSGEWEGVYTHGFEVSDFQRCGNTEVWWASGDLRALQAILPDSDRRGVYVVVDGEVSDSGRYGHLGGYPRQLDIRQVRYASSRVPTRCR